MSKNTIKFSCGNTEDVTALMDIQIVGNRDNENQSALMLRAAIALIEASDMNDFDSNEYDLFTQLSNDLSESLKQLNSM